MDEWGQAEGIGAVRPDCRNGRPDRVGRRAGAPPAARASRRGADQDCGGRGSPPHSAAADGRTWLAGGIHRGGLGLAKLDRAGRTG
jgi:hypothetical protein